jgi:hypothetical protein
LSSPFPSLPLTGIPKLELNNISGRQLIILSSDIDVHGLRKPEGKRIPKPTLKEGSFSASRISYLGNESGVTGGKIKELRIFPKNC